MKLLGMGKGMVSVGFGSLLDVSKGHQELRSTGLEPGSSDFGAMGFIMVLQSQSKVGSLYYTIRFGLPRWIKE